MRIILYYLILQATFRTQGLGDLYKRYARRLQNAYFNVYLMCQISLSVLYIGVLLVVNQVSQHLVIGSEARRTESGIN